jgi:hypothetical protein
LYRRATVETSPETRIVDMELKRTAKSVIERIVHLRDSL